ncbi:hypothetical protein E4665_17080 [Sporolactobacillus shoreae]|uniref:DUF1737 domain-containing protein n=1 Tax=Sporolactobacillus shoreae TaxID=1465501 RepID=A0A4Z0GJ84_9BACL|nr:hypothetical protein [Sporolactobacillus shoreae]TGA95982.1 hypothetical protein E4665_17080 [Sporolactobacillus shoreae]
MNDIVHIENIEEHTNIDQVNDFLKSGWKLIGVGPIMQDDYQEIVYIVGADKKTYDKYKKEIEASKADDFF